MDVSSIEFEFETDRSIYFDMRDIQINVALKKWRLFDDVMKKDKHGKEYMGMIFKDDGLHYLIHVNNLLHSLFSNCEVYLYNQVWQLKWTLRIEGFTFQTI